MRLIDRYILKEFLGPFLFGVGTFIILLVGVQLSPQMLRLLVRDHYPASVVLHIFIYRMPAALALTFPMATIFGSLMCMATLSSNGEVVAMRAGGVSLARLARPILVTGVLVSILNLGFNELLVPTANDRAYEFETGYAASAKPLTHITFQIPSTGAPQRIVHVQLFDPGRKLLKGLLILEMRNGQFWQIWSAKQAEWREEKWYLVKGEHTIAQPDGSQRKDSFDLIQVDVGKTPDELARREKDLVDMSLPDLIARLKQLRLTGQPYKPDILAVIQTIYMRMALPWACLGFALIGVPLGLRPTRATTGIGLGLSLVIVFAYYVIFNTMTLIGQQGSLPPVLVAWLPNLVLFGAGLGLFAGARRK